MLRPFSGRFSTCVRNCVGELRIFHIDLGRFACNFDDFARLAQLHLEVEMLNRSRVQGEASVLNRLKPLGFHRDLVGADRKFLGRE